jgi:hypothetical protein
VPLESPQRSEPERIIRLSEFSPSAPTSLLALLITLRSIVPSRRDLQLEILVLRHQIGDPGVTFCSHLMGAVAVVESAVRSLHHTSSSHILGESISTMERRSSPCGFVRINRSALVNPASVEVIQP